ncbi:MAG TPA: NAD(P)-binding oxidoreductase [Ornithinibacter sp.]|nr:NAD(P)-binding oxidoreductase [Ornithinibacter sp.]
MRILVIGATGGSGRAVCDSLLERGHSVTALARSATAMAPREQLDRVDGDAADVELLERVMPGHDAVVITLGISEPAWRVRLLGARATAGDIRSRGTDAVVRAARGAGVDRIVVQTSYGVGPTRPHLGIAERLVFALLLKPQMRDTERQEEVVRASGLEWTLVQPVYLTDVEDDTHVTSTDGRTRRTRVSRRGVAAVHADLVESGAHRHDTVSVSG